MRESRFARYILSVSILLIGISAHIDGRQAQAASQTAPPAGPAPSPAGPTAAGAAATKKPVKPQPRPHSTRISVDLKLIEIDDGDTIQIKWGPNDVEEVRILGIDCPETRHVQHDIPYSQNFGEEAKAFARGTFATATKVELLRATMLDPYDRTLGYVFVNDKNYSVLVVEARLAEESITAFGDNGFPQEAAVVLASAKGAGPLPFEPPYQYRNRMRRVSEWMKGKGIYPAQ
jgi:endonuclease YncB( thermonuclease family)